MFRQHRIRKRHQWQRRVIKKRTEGEGEKTKKKYLVYGTLVYYPAVYIIIRFTDIYIFMITVSSTSVANVNASPAIAITAAKY